MLKLMRMRMPSGSVRARRLKPRQEELQGGHVLSEEGVAPV